MEKDPVAVIEVLEFYSDINGGNSAAGTPIGSPMINSKTNNNNNDPNNYSSAKNNVQEANLQEWVKPPAKSTVSQFKPSRAAPKPPTPYHLTQLNGSSHQHTSSSGSLPSSGNNNNNNNNSTNNNNTKTFHH